MKVGQGPNSLLCMISFRINFQFTETDERRHAIHSDSDAFLIVKGKDIPVTGHGGPYGCETSRLPHYLDNRLTDGGTVVSLTHRPPFTPQEDSWYSFLLETESTPGP
jgi:hypothetical protein